MNEVCFCIPARYESTRLPKKLLLKLGEFSCIQHTIQHVSKSAYFNNNIYVLTDNEIIQRELSGFPCQVVMTSNNCINGSERISSNLHLIPSHYKYIVNIQGDEPFVSSINIDHCIQTHLKQHDKHIFYTTLHEETNSPDYVRSIASIKLVTNVENDILYYSRNIIPWNKQNEAKLDYIYKTFTGIYVFNREKIELFNTLPNTDLQLHEDCEQLKILEHGYKIKSFPTIEYNEISLNTPEDFEFLSNKYNNTCC